jgi:AcrR family transcriptional regulator
MAPTGLKWTRCPCDIWFAGVTVDQIVAAAGVSRRTFFRYFETKEEALLADYPELNARLTESLVEGGVDHPLEAVRAGLHRLADWYVERADAVLERSQVIRDTVQLGGRNLEFLSQWENAIASTVAFHIDADPGSLLPRTAGATLVGAFRAALTQWVRSYCADDLHALIDETFDVVGRGLINEIGKAALSARS